MLHNSCWSMNMKKKEEQQNKGQRKKTNYKINGSTANANNEHFHLNVFKVAWDLSQNRKKKNLNKNQVLNRIRIRFAVSWDAECLNLFTSYTPKNCHVIKQNRQKPNPNKINGQMEFYRWNCFFFFTFPRIQ